MAPLGPLTHQIQLILLFMHTFIAKYPYTLKVQYVYAHIYACMYLRAPNEEYKIIPILAITSVHIAQRTAQAACTTGSVELMIDVN